MSTEVIGGGFGSDDLDADIARYAQHLKEQHKTRPKLTLLKINEKEYHLEFLHCGRHHKIEITGGSAENVLMTFLRKHSEEMLGIEFAIKDKQ